MATLPLPPTTEVQITRVVKALYDAAPGNLYLQAFTQYAADNGGVVGVADGLLYEHRNKSNAEVAQLIVKNLGLAKVDESLGVADDPAKSAAKNAEAFLLWQFNVAEQTGATRGQVLVEALNNLATLGSDPIFGKAADYFNTSIAQAYSYSVDPANSTYDLAVLELADEVGVGEGGEVVPPAVPGMTFMLTPGSDTADSAGSFRNGSNVEGAFKFTAANEIIIASTATLDAGGNPDSLIDPSTSDNDVMNLAFNGNITTSSIQNIETINVAASGVAGTLTLTGVSGLKTIKVSGNPTAGVTLEATAGGNDIGDTGVTTIDASGLTSNAAVLTVSSAASTSTAALTITGGNAADVITGGLGADTIVGGAGNDQLNGGAGNDNISGGTGNDFIQGVNGNDTLKGEAGNDNIDGGLGNDTIEGGAGVDIIVTTGGNDKVTAGAGNDEIVLGTFGGGLAANTTAANVQAAGVAANAGNNTVVFEADAAANGNDNIYGFDAGAVTAANGGDILDFSAFLGADVAFSDLVAVTDGNDDTLTDFNVIYLDNTIANITDVVTYANNAKLVVIEDDGTDLIVNYVTTDANGNATATAVATLVGVTSAALIEANFA